MKKAFLPEITYMRGLCMLGVIGIHVGSYALQNPFVNLELISVLEILSRFGVPAFFFLSAFGLFYHTSVEGPFSYKEFMHRRIQVVLFPYITWSIFYLLYTGMTAHNLGNLHPGPLAINLLFGTSMYHLYFMVILLWFYVMMPLWRAMVKVILKRPVFWLVLLFVIQVGIDYVSSYMLGRWVTENLSNQPVLKYLFDMRLNYWVIHYVWIFLLGAVCAERYEIVCGIYVALSLPFRRQCGKLYIIDAWLLLLCHGRMALYCVRSNLHGTSNESYGRSLYRIGNDV